MSVDVQLALGVGAFVLVLFLVAMLAPRRERPSLRTDGRLDVLARRVEEIDGIARLALHDTRNLRMSVGALATKDSVTGVTVQVAEVRGQLIGLVANSAATTRSIGRIEDWLLSNSAPMAPTAKGAEEKS